MPITQNQMDKINEITRSLNSAIKLRGGAWASPAQGRFILDFINGLSEPSATLAPQSSIQIAKPYACSKMLVLSHPSSYRGHSFWMHYVVDEGGVILRGTHNLDASKTTAVVKRVSFQRATKFTPVADFFPKVGTIISRQNKVLIKKLKALSSGGESDFTTSTINKLERGETLSPKHMTAVQSVLLRDRYGAPEDLPSAKEIRSKAKALGVSLPVGLSFNKSADKRKALVLLEGAEKKAKRKAVKRAFETLGGTDGCYMNRQNLIATHSHLREILEHLEANPCVEDWAESKIAQAHAILQAVAEYFKYGKR